MLRAMKSFDGSGAVTIAGPTVIDQGQIIMLLVSQPDGSAAAVTLNKSDVQALVNTLTVVML